ncbi:MAG: TrkH family potassium uptake protein [Clostridia bacterium]|nr:TrkH family potassium uptake protein [Clostridia bacterium]
MNFRMIWRILSFILLVEAVFMLPAMLLCAFQKETVSAVSFLITIGIVLAAASVLWLLSRKAKKGFYSRDGLICVGLSWIVMSLFGALPFRISGVIPNYIDALFEIASGFSTTGASIINNVEALPKGMLLWRSMSHWLGGMGVLVFLLALVPISGRNDGYTMHLLRAESPGPDVGKLVPRMKQTATILYALYIGLTVLDFIFLVIGKMPVFDAVCIAVGTAGTGGFAVTNDSIASYSPYIQGVCTVFMFLFGVNFTCYYLLICGKIKNVLKDEELHWYLGIALVAIIAVTLNVRSIYDSWGETIRYSAFQVGTFMSSTGFATTDFDQWPTLSKAIIFSLMFIGASAGSTGGGFKVGRGLLVIKMIRRNVRQVLYPQKIQVVRLNGRVVDEGVLRNTNAYLCTYVIIILASFILISFDNFSTMTNLTAVVSCFNNMGPGLEGIGPTLNYSGYSLLSKLVLIFDMLAGRLEIFPILVLFSRSAWRRR